MTRVSAADIGEFQLRVDFDRSITISDGAIVVARKLPRGTTVGIRLPVVLEKVDRLSLVTDVPFKISF